MTRRPSARPARIAAWVLAGALWTAGCAGTAPRGELGSHDPAAIEELRANAEANPNDPAAARDLGIALFHSGDAPGAVESLERATNLDPRDESAVYFLARATDSAGLLDRSLAAYSSYLGLSQKGSAEVRARIEALTLQKATLEVEDAISAEKSLSLREVPQNSIAVPDFTNAAGSDTLAPLARGLAQMVITDLNRVRALRVVERQRLRVLLDEIDLGQGESTRSEGWPSIQTTEGIKARLAALARKSTGAPYYSGAIDDAKSDSFAGAVRDFQSDHGLTADGKVGPKTRAALTEAMASVPRPPRSQPAVASSGLAGGNAPRVGLLLGARRFFQGSFAPLGGREIQLDGALLETSGGGSKPVGDAVRGPIKNVLSLEKSLVRQALETLGIEPTPEEWREIEKLPTDNYLAFLAYSQGLVDEDNGDIPAARAAYQRAVRLDSGFVDARLRVQVTGAFDKDMGELDRSQTPSGGSDGDDLTDRLLRTGGWGGLGPGPEIDRDGTDDPTVTDAIIAGENGGNATILIEGDLPSGGRP